MRKITATIIKEWILLRRDIGGVMLLFLMPAMLIVVMALVQDAPFRDYQELRFDLLLADNDRGSLATEIKTGLKQSKNFHVVDSLSGQPVTEAQLKQLLLKGDYKVGIVIPKGATAEVVNSANLLANGISRKLGLGTLPAREPRDGTFISVYFDPVAKPTFRSSISSAIDKFITFSCSNLLVKRLSKLSKAITDSSGGDDFRKIFQGIGVKEEVLSDTPAYANSINSVQHNVPAWAIFGMFFIVIPIAGHMIREREDGSAIRLALIPGAQTTASIGRILFYTLICSVQFWLMVAIGVWFLPLLKLPALYAGPHAWVLIPVSVAIAFAATCYGYFTGTVFRTINQAMPFGAISIVILSALGGIWVPVELLPAVMQHVARISPLHWGLGAVHQVMLRNGNWQDVLPQTGCLLLFGALLWGVSVYRNNIRHRSVQ